MSGHVRFGFAALLVIAFSTPAASNPFTDLFSPSPAPEPAPAAPAAPAPAADACLAQPGTSTAPGQHWVYRYDGHRKCWFQAEASTAVARKPVHRHAARQRAAAPDDTESAPRGQTLRPLVRSVHVSEPADGVAEACAVVDTGPRRRAVALRLEGMDGRWQCTALQLG